MGAKTRVLILEDLPTDSDLAEREIRRVDPDCEFRVVDTRQGFEETLASFRPDIVLSDYRLPQFDGMTALAIAQQHDPDLPFIIVTGSINEETAVECMKSGAWDYVIKEHIRRLGPAFLNAMNRRSLRRERRLAEAALCHSEAKFRNYVENAPIGIFQVDGEGNFLDANPAVLQFTGYSAGEIRAMSILDLVPEASRGEVTRFLGLLKDCGWSSWESPILQKGGNQRWWQVEGTSFEEGRYLGYATDTTEERKALSDLARESAYLEQLFMNSPLTIQLCELDGTILRVNATCERMFGFSQQELVGHKIDEFIVSPEELGLARQYTETFSVQDGLAFEAVRKRKDGTPIDVAFTGFPVHMEGSRTGVFAIYQDISKRKQAEREREEINRQLRKKVSELERAWDQSVQVLAIASEARDPYTAGHQRRVAKLSKAIALEMGMGETRSRQVEMAALVHDVGKIEVPSEILVKPGRLNPLEFKLIQVHPASAHRILSAIDLPWPLAEIVYQHHEAMDGSGYPRGLAGEQILPEARIISVADTVEAMSSHRPYRPARGLGAALDELRKGRGIRYDAAAVDACLEVFAKGFGWEG